MSTNLVLNWGIVSTGRISQDFCTALLTLKTPKQNLYACAARNVDDARKFAGRFDIPKAYGSYDELFADKDVNIVYIGTISPTHKDLSIKAMNAGKYVLCEKPMAMNSKEQEEVFAASKLNNKFFMEAIWTRHFPLIERLKDEVQKIGDIQIFNSNFTVQFELKNKELGGGAIYDFGIYPIQLACLAFNHEKPIKITASGSLLPSGVDKCSSISLLYSDGRLAVLNVSAGGAFFAPTQIIGTKGVLQIPDFSFAPTELILPNGEIVKSPLPDCPATNFPNSVGLRYQAEGAYEAISKGLIEHSKMTHDNSRLICHIMDEARKQIGYTD